MNTVKKCSISGIAFTLDVDAYETLSAYLESLRTRYADHKDGEEIVADIEARIAELILSTQDGERTVELPLVRNIIAQMGSPEEIGEPEERTEEAGAPKQDAPRIPRRLYRDPEGAKLGGVCTGLGEYFDLDPVWMRLIFFAPLFSAILTRALHFPGWFYDISKNMFGFFILGYLIMWFVVPAARTARQKLEMKGERITSDSIGSMTSGAGGVDGYPKNVVASTVSVFGTVLLILLKLFAGLMVFCLILTACALVLGLFSLGTASAFVPDFFGYPVMSWTAVLGLLIALIPCLLMIYVLMCLIASRRPSGRWTLATFLLWIVTLFLLIGAAVSEYGKYGVAEYWDSGALPEPSRDVRNLLEDAETDDDDGESFGELEEALQAGEEE